MILFCSIEVRSVNGDIGVVKAVGRMSVGVAMALGSSGDGRGCGSCICDDRSADAGGGDTAIEVVALVASLLALVASAGKSGPMLIPSMLSALAARGVGVLSSGVCSDVRPVSVPFALLPFSEVSGCSSEASFMIFLFPRGRRSVTMFPTSKLLSASLISVGCFPSPRLLASSTAAMRSRGHRA